MPTLLLADLVKEELALRQQAQIEVSLRQEKIEKLIKQFCIVSPEHAISRQEWQDFCFQHLFNRTCHANSPFVIYLNELMPQLGYALGWAHTKIGVYRGLTWKPERRAQLNALIE